MSWSPVDLTNVLEGDGQPDGPSVFHREDGIALLYRGKAHAIYSETEAGKTWLAVTAAREQLHKGETVVFLDFEDTAWTIVDRLLALGTSGDAIAERLRYISPDEPLRPRSRADLKATLEEEPALVIHDGITAGMQLFGLNPNDNTDVANYANQVRRPFVECGAAFVELDHVAKSVESRGRFGIGAQHKLASIDGAAFALETVRPFGRGLTGVSTLRVTKDRPGHLRQHAGAGGKIAEVRFHSDPDGGVQVEIRAPEGASGEFRPTVLMERASRYIETNPGATQRDVEHGVTGRAEYVRSAMSILTDEGFIDPGDDPKKRNYTSVTPFRDGAES